ncbi:SET domain-containing protein [Delitschia confertaspora ATCC 74209]|uniref:SET domain-containing protein n=1 Tax=Delitschia confertaspora ATCC 74209 TaxID=1513339 RepID=A0A9P4JHC5_9PLEO|nr:SET domain-containing protein [Delitschia confertaspora ATCC 74209]
MRTFHNTYEESPERLKELFQNADNIKGRRPNSKQSRNSLLSTHERHLKLLSEGNLPVKTIILPPPYPPSPTPLKDEKCKGIRLNELRYGVRDHIAFLLLKVISKPYIHSNTILIAEDESGDVARLTFCNLEDSLLDPIFFENDVIAVKQPCWTQLPDDAFHIRVDHPSDFVKLEEDDELIPETWRAEKKEEVKKTAEEWKKEGDMAFLKKKFRVAMKCYKNGLLAPSLTISAKTDLHRKKCGVNIVLTRLDDAATDLANAICSLLSTSSSHSPSLNPLQIVTWLHEDTPMNLLPEALQSVPKPFLELASRIKFDLGVFQPTPVYDFPLMTSYVTPLTLHLDCPNYTSSTMIRQTPTHGRGLFASKAFKRGELILVEKAFVLPSYVMEDKRSQCLLCFGEMVKKVQCNPSLRKKFFELDAGSSFSRVLHEGGGGEGIKGEDTQDVPDVFRIHAILRHNSFNAPLTSFSLLHQPHQEMRTGIWLHASSINHSCIPNSVRTFVGDIFVLRATRDVKEGEEVVMQYLSPDVDEKVRAERLGEWGFECRCRLCEVDESIGEVEREERGKLFEQLKGAVMKAAGNGVPPTNTAIKKIAKMTRELESLYDAHSELYASLPRLALVHPTLWLAEAYRTAKNTGKGVEYSLKLLRNFGIIIEVDHEKQEFKVVSEKGLVNVEVVRALKYLREDFVEKGEERLAEQAGGLARAWWMCVTGSEVGMVEFLGF